MDFEIIIQECFLGDPLPKLLKRFCYIEQNGRQGINSSGQNPLNFHHRSLEGVSDQWSIINRLNELMQGMYIC